MADVTRTTFEDQGFHPELSHARDGLCYGAVGLWWPPRSGSPMSTLPMHWGESWLLAETHHGPSLVLGQVLACLLGQALIKEVSPAPS